MGSLGEWTWGVKSVHAVCQVHKFNLSTKISIKQKTAVPASYTDVGGPKRTKFLCGCDDLQLKSPQALPLERTLVGSSTVTGTSCFKDHSAEEHELDPSCQGQRPPAPQ